MRTLEGALTLSGGAKNQDAALRRRDLNALLAVDLLEVISVAMGEVAVVTAVATDGAGVVFGDEGTAVSRPDVRSAFGTSGTIEIAR